jgi:indole-3-glycerol phosphate synthase
MTIIEKIIAHKCRELADNKLKKPVKVFERSRLFKRTTLPLSASILNPDKTGIIAEFKRKSPSKGIINSQAILEEVTTGYFRFGASGISILTDKKFFGGSVDDLIRARELNPIPILRKEFIIDEYQIIETKAIGADAILLIASVLDVRKTYELARFAKSLDLQVLLEVHKATELDHLNEFVSMVGVNNRDLNTFQVDTEISFQLADMIPTDFVKISESGIHSPAVIKKLKRSRYQGFLIGESFMLAQEPVTAFSDFVKLLLFEND